MNAKEPRAGQLYSDTLKVFTRKQHLDSVQVLLCLFLGALGKPHPSLATVKSPAALSRFLNHYAWSLKALIRVMRSHALSTFQKNRKICRDRPPRVELIIDLTSLGKEGDFAGLEVMLQEILPKTSAHLRG